KPDIEPRWPLGPFLTDSERWLEHPVASAEAAPGCRCFWRSASPATALSRLAGPIQPNAESTSKPGRDSANVGTSGENKERCGEPIAIARAFPALTCSQAVEKLSHASLMWPAIRSCICRLEARYATADISR